MRLPLLLPRLLGTLSLLLTLLRFRLLSGLLAPLLLLRLAGAAALLFLRLGLLLFTRLRPLLPIDPLLGNK